MPQSWYWKEISFSVILLLVIIDSKTLIKILCENVWINVAWSKSKIKLIFKVISKDKLFYSKKSKIPIPFIEKSNFFMKWK